MTILVTGVSRGLGFEVAQLLLEKGHKVIGVSRRAPPLVGDGFSFIQHDLGDVHSSADFGKSIASQYQIDGLVLNAAIVVSDFENQSLDWKGFTNQVDINALAPISLYSSIAAHCNRPLQVAVVSSLSTQLDPYKSRVGYPASKSLLSSAFENLALKSANGSNIRIYEFGALSTDSSGLLTLKRSAAAQSIVEGLLAAKSSATIRRPYLTYLLGFAMNCLPLPWRRKLVSKRNA